MPTPIYRSYFIYKAIEKLTELIYIGQTHETIEKRFKGHLREDRYEFDRAYTDPDNFTVLEIDRIDNVLHRDPDEQCWREYLSEVYADGSTWTFKSQEAIELDQMEKYYIWRDNAQDVSVGYNRTAGGVSFANTTEHQAKAGAKGAEKWLATTTPEERSQQFKDGWENKSEQQREQHRDSVTEVWASRDEEEKSRITKQSVATERKDFEEKHNIIYIAGRTEHKETYGSFERYRREFPELCRPDWFLRKVGFSCFMRDIKLFKPGKYWYIRHDAMLDVYYWSEYQEGTCMTFAETSGYNNAKRRGPDGKFVKKTAPDQLFQIPALRETW